MVLSGRGCVLLTLGTDGNITRRKEVTMRRFRRSRPRRAMRRGRRRSFGRRRGVAPLRIGYRF